MLNIFIGAPARQQDDSEAVTQFMNETGEKIILGGTAISVFERETGAEARVDLSTGSDGVPPFGEIAGMMAAEGSITLDRLNDIFSIEYERSNAASVLKSKILKASGIKIYRCRAYNAVNGIDKESVVSELITNIERSGIKPEIIVF